MIIYHEANPDTLDSILTHGLKQMSGREQGSDDLILQTDHLLERNLPQTLREAGVSRHRNIYGYMAIGQNVVNIHDGTLIPSGHKARSSDYLLLRLDVSPERCYVSNLDIYDSIKSAINNNEATRVRNEIALLYWDSLVRLDHYTSGQILRPEVMVTYDVPAKAITVVRSS